MKNLKFATLAAALIGITSFSAPAQVLVSFSYPAAAPAGSGDPVATPAPTNETSDATGAIGLGADLGATGNSFISGYLTHPSADPSTLSAAITDGNYYTFTISPTTGNQVSLTSFDLSKTAFYSDSGNATFALESSVTGFGTGTGNILDTYASGTTGNNLPLVDPGFAHLTSPAEFRIYAYGGNPFYLSLQGGPLNIDGTGAVIPEPSTWALLGLGFGFFLFAARNARLRRA